MGIRKKVRNKWKAERKEQIKKISAKRLKKTQKEVTKSGNTDTKKGKKAV